MALKVETELVWFKLAPLIVQFGKVAQFHAGVLVELKVTKLPLPDSASFIVMVPDCGPVVVIVIVQSET